MTGTSCLNPRHIAHAHGPRSVATTRDARLEDRLRCRDRKGIALIAHEMMNPCRVQWDLTCSSPDAISSNRSTPTIRLMRSSFAFTFTYFYGYRQGPGKRVRVK